jgi:hypothetical protein
MKTVKSTTKNMTLTSTAKAPKVTKAEPAVIAKKLAESLKASAPAPKPVQSAPVATPSAAPVIGNAVASKRITVGTAVTEYRIVPSQRKSFKGYFIQGGTFRKAADTGRDMFDVAVEIPHTELVAAKAQLATLRAGVAKVA